MEINYVLIMISLIIGIIIGCSGSLCVYKSLSIDKDVVTKTPIETTTSQTGGSVKNCEKQLFHALIPKLNNFEYEGYNSNSCPNYVKV